MSLDTPYVNGAEKLKQRIATLRSRLQLPALTTEIANLIRRRTIERFDREVDPDGIPWKPLAESTILRKRRGGYGNKKKLVRTESLRGAIRIIRGGLGATYTNTGAGFRIGVEDPKIAQYARIQNNGNRRIPARRFLGIGRLDVKAVDSLLRRKAKELDNIT